MLLFDQHDEPDADFVRQMERLAALAADVESIHRGVPPETMAGADAPILDRWILGQRLVPCLAGLSTGHPELAGQNRLIGTSDLWLLSKDHGWARTLSRWYRLGRPAERGRAAARHELLPGRSRRGYPRICRTAVATAQEAW